MAERGEDDDLKLSYLIAAIHKADNVAQEIKDKLTDAKLGPAVSNLSKDEVFSLYRLRYHILTSQGKSNQGWADLLEKLEGVDSSIQVVITILRIDEGVYMAFTDKDHQTCFGVIA